MAGRSYLFHFCDPKASFAAGSEGVKTRRLQGSMAARLGPEAWELGRRAYEPLRTVAGDEVSVDDLLEFIADEQPCIDEFFEALSTRAQAGTIKLVRPDGEEHARPLEWREADWTWQVMTMVKFLNSKPGGFDEPAAEMFGAHMLVAALLALDTAVVCSMGDDSAGVSSSLLDAAWLVDQVESLERNEREARALLKKLETARASARAKLRHARDPKRKAKEFVRECWVRWRQAPETFASASAFARAMLDKLPEQLTSEVVVTRWVREWEREGKEDSAK